MFNFLGRDFFNALSEKDEALFQVQIFRYLGGFVVGIPVFVFRTYYQVRVRMACSGCIWVFGQARWCHSNRLNTVNALIVRGDLGGLIEHNQEVVCGCRLDVQSPQNP